MSGEIAAAVGEVVEGKASMTDLAKVAELRKAFDASHINKLPRVTCGDCRKAPSRNCSKHSKTKCTECGQYMTTAHMHLDYVGHAQITDRLLSVDPAWTWAPVAEDEAGLPRMLRDDKGNPVGLWINLTVCGVTRLGYGSCESGKSEAVKELIGDALRNAAMRFGVALDLWMKDVPEASTSAPKAAKNPPAKTAAPATPPREATGESSEEGQPPPSPPVDKHDASAVPVKDDQVRYRRRMFAVGKDIGLTADDLKPLTLQRFSVASSTELTHGQWTDLLGFLEGLKELGAAKVGELVIAAKADLTEARG